MLLIRSLQTYLDTVHIHVSDDDSRRKRTTSRNLPFDPLEHIGDGFGTEMTFSDLPIVASMLSNVSEQVSANKLTLNCIKNF